MKVINKHNKEADASGRKPWPCKGTGRPAPYIELRTERAHATASRGQVIHSFFTPVSACHVTVISDLQSDPGLWLAPDLAMGTGPCADVHTARHRRTGGVEEEGLHVCNSFRFLPASFLGWLVETSRVYVRVSTVSSK
jgi:hypothetical protein